MRVTAAIKYYLFSRHRRGDGIHSPFLYEFIREILIEDRGRGGLIRMDGGIREGGVRDRDRQFERSTLWKENWTEDSRLIEGIRKELLKDKSLLKYEDPGMGHGRGAGKSGRVVKQLAKDAAVKKKYGKLLYKLAGRLGGENMLELGTNLGIGSMYLALGAAKSTLHTIEAAEPVLDIARNNFKKAGIENIKTYRGTFTDKLPEVFGNIPALDIVYFDGDHNGKRTIKYFETCLEKAGADSLFVFDDIHWSKDMERAWKEIISREEVKLSLDLLQMGLVFFRKGLSKQHFVIRY